MSLNSFFRFQLLVVKNLGSSPFIGKSSIFVGIQGEFQVILDAGSHSDAQSKPNMEDFTYQKYKFNPNKADALIISHAHVDHAGALLNNNFIFNGKILMSKVTKALTVMNINQAIKMNKNQSLDVVQNRVLTEVEYFKPYQINSYSQTTITLYPVPHISGASFVLITTSNNRKILYTGDFNTLYLQFIQQPLILYPELQNIDVLITETTFSSTIFQQYYLSQLNSYTNCLINILTKNQTIITTSAQEALSYLQLICHLCDRLKMQNFITTSKKPFSVVEGSTRTYLQALTISAEQADLGGLRSIFYRDFFNPRNIKNQILLVTTPKQVNAASSLESLFQFGQDPNALFLLAGAVQPGSCNWRLINGGVKEIKRDNQKVYTDIEAQFDQIGQVGHSDFVGLCRLIKQTQCKVVIGTHCAQIENLKLFEQMGDVFNCKVCCLVGVIAIRLWQEECNNIRMQKQDVKNLEQKLYRVKTQLQKDIIIERLRQIGIVVNQNFRVKDDGEIDVICNQGEIEFICQQLGISI